MLLYQLVLPLCGLHVCSWWDLILLQWLFSPKVLFLFYVLLFHLYALHNNYMFHMHPFLASPHSLPHDRSIILLLSSPLPHPLLLELTPSLHQSPPPLLNFHIHITSDLEYPSFLDHMDKVSLPSLLRPNPLKGTLPGFRELSFLPG